MAPRPLLGAVLERQAGCLSRPIKKLVRRFYGIDVGKLIGALALAGTATLTERAVASEPIVVLVVPRTEARAADWRHIEYRLVAELRSVGLEVVKQSLGPGAPTTEQGPTPWQELLVGQRAVAILTARRVNGWLALYVLLPGDQRLRPVQTQRFAPADPGQPEEQILAAVEVVNEASLTLQVPRASGDTRPTPLPTDSEVFREPTSAAASERGLWTLRVGAGVWNSAPDGAGLLPAVQGGIGRSLGSVTTLELDAGFTPWSQDTLASAAQRFASLGLLLVHDLWPSAGLWPSLGLGPVVLLAVTGSTGAAQSNQRSLAVFGGAFKATWPLEVSAGLQLRPGISALLTQPLVTRFSRVFVTTGEVSDSVSAERQAWFGVSLEGAWSWN